MIYTTSHQSVLGEIRLASKDHKLIGLWFLGQTIHLPKFHTESTNTKSITQRIQVKHDDVVLLHTKQWLQQYFAKKNPSINELPLNPHGSAFGKLVWNLITQIPYGEVCSYGELAKEVAKQTHKNAMSAQAIGGALKRNPIAIIIPCHRVIGTNKKLTGYAGGIDKKTMLLEHEQSDLEQLYRFKNS